MTRTFLSNACSSNDGLPIPLMHDICVALLNPYFKDESKKPVDFTTSGLTDKCLPSNLLMNKKLLFLLLSLFPIQNNNSSGILN